MALDVTIFSEGVRMAGQLYTPGDFSAESNCPVVVSCHGWTAPLMEDMRKTGYGEDLAEAGYCLLIFDYRGWGASDSGSESREGVLDPFSWAADVTHALDFIEHCPGIDSQRIGLLGSSVGGGVAVYVASRDDRVKCMVSQMGAQDLRGSDELGYTDGLPFWSISQMHERARQAASDGDFPQSVPVPDLIVRSMGYAEPVSLSAAIHPDVRWWAPIDDAETLTVPILVLDAGDEHNWDIAKHGGRLAARINTADRTEVEYQVIDGARHVMDTYRLMGTDNSPEGRMRRAGTEWFIKHL